MKDVSLSAWDWWRDTVRDHRLQLWPHRGRKTADFQGTDPTQSRGDTLNLSRCCQVLAFSFHGWCLLVHQAPSTVYFNVRQVPQSSLTHAPWKISGQPGVSHIWPFSDVAHSRSFRGVLTVVGFCPPTAERFSIWTCWQTSPSHVSTLKISWTNLQYL